MMDSGPDSGLKLKKPQPKALIYEDLEVSIAHSRQEIEQKDGLPKPVL